MTKNNTNIKSTGHALCLRKSVLRTLAYYRAVKTPLTITQIGRYLISNNTDAKNSLSDIRKVLDNLVNREIVSRQKGLYWLTSGKIDNRVWLKYIQLEKTAQRKINKVRKALKIFSNIPFLRAIFICGSVARKVSRPGSDIDFLILTKRDRTWTVRFFMTIFSFLLGKKTRDKKTVNYQSLAINHNYRRNKFCLNHYRSSSNLKLEENLRDLYSAQEYARMINIYSSNRIDRKFFKKNKKWMQNYLPNFNFTKLPLFKNSRSGIENMLAGKIGNIIEKLLYYLQVRKIEFSRSRIPARPAGGYPASTGQRLITDEGVIMFHLNPRAPIVLKKYEQITKYNE